MDSRLRAICDLFVPDVREGAGRHEYDGHLQDLSPAGVRQALSALPSQPAEASETAKSTSYDEALLRAFEDKARAVFGELELHRVNPMYHLANLDVAGYDLEYAPGAERDEARRRHVAGWPDAMDAAIEALDRVPAPVAQACLDKAEALATSIETVRGHSGDDDVRTKAEAAHERLVKHLRTAAASGPPDTTLGAEPFRRLLSASEAIDVDLTALAERANRDRARMWETLTEACGHLEPKAPVAEVVGRLLADHPDTDGVLAEARAITAEVIAWTTETHLAPADGECLVEEAPPTRRWSMASISPAAPYDPDHPSHYYVTGPDASWPVEDREDWLAVFSRTTLPAITVHEVAPGHFSHFRAMRAVTGDVRRSLHSDAFIEGWAHYAEELALQEGFRAADPRFAVGVALEALIRLARLTASIGLHTGGMSVEEAAALFTDSAFLRGPAALAEARRGTFDPTYGRYTWGKLEIQELRERAMSVEGAAFTLPGFHHSLLALGSPPLGLLDWCLPR